jgi:hypothetical protein
MKLQKQVQYSCLSSQNRNLQISQVIFQRFHITAARKLPMCYWTLAAKGDRRGMKSVLYEYTIIPSPTSLQCHATRVYSHALQNIVTWNVTEASFIVRVRITLSEHQVPTLGPSHCVPAIVYRAARHWIPSPLHDKECLLSSNLTLCCTRWQQTLLQFSPS